MVFINTGIGGVYLIDIEKKTDERGFFARTFCLQEFETHGLISRFVQCSISFNKKRGTLRGMHFQVAPCAEVKLVRCTAGAIYDVAVDLRPESATYKQWIAAELNVSNRRAIYIPKGCAHGFLTLLPDTEVSYQISEFYQPEAARGFRWNDPAFRIEWPLADAPVLSERDRSYIDYES